MSTCKCGHPSEQHIGGAGLCTDAACDCDGYVARPRELSSEAKALAIDLVGVDSFGRMESVANAAQDLIDQRTAWEREAAKLLAQRDYAERRANEVEGRLATFVEQLRAVLAKFDVGAVR